MKIIINKYMKLVAAIAVMSLVSFQLQAQEECDCLNETFTAYAVAEPGTFNEMFHSQLYLLTDVNGNILASNMTGSFPNLMSDTDYSIYAVNLLDLDLMNFQNDIIGGSNISDLINLTGDFANYCFDLNPNSASYNCTCITFVCPTLGEVSTTGPICSDETFDITATGLLDVLQTENNETDFQIVFGFYNGIVTNPNPYTTAPDGLFAMGNSVTPVNGVASLTGMGLGLDAGTFTVVAYLSPAPESTICQPVVTTEITIFEEPVVDLGDDIQACSGEALILDAGVGFNSYTWSTGETSQTITVTQPGMYSVTVSNANNCIDSDDIMVVFNNTISTNNPITICEGSSYILPDGTEVSIAGNYPVTLTSTAGCDSVVTTILSLNTSLATDNPITICIGENYILPDGTEVSAAGDYPVTLTSTAGCDSVVTTILSINEVLNSNEEVTICEGEMFTLPDGSSVSTSGVYPVTIISVAGCDSIVTTTLTVNLVLSSDNPISICEGSIYILPDGAEVSTAGNYLVTLSSTAGCDSVVTTILTVNSTLETDNPIAICEGSNYILPDGSEVSAAGNYPVTLASTAGCDSVVTTILTVNTTLETDNPITICEGSNYILPDGSEVSAAGNYPVTLTSTAGCDSVVTTILTVNTTLETDNPITICEGSNYILPDGSEVSAAGNYPVTLASTAGCDSVVTTILTVNTTLETDNPITICEGSNYILPDGTEVSAAGNYPVTLASTAGCDSVVTTILTVNELPVVSISGELDICSDGTGATNSDETTALFATMGFDSYLWSTGQTNQAIIVTAGGDYTVTATDTNGCSGSAIVTVAENDCTILTEICDCENEVFTAYAVAEPDTYQTIDYTQVYILTDDAGNVITFNGNGFFENLASNITYYIYAANVKDEDIIAFEANLTNIASVQNETDAYANLCYELNINNATYFCNCVGFVCPEIAAVETGGSFCVGETIDLTVSGISNILQSQNGESDFGILVGAFNGTLSNPDPYTTTPGIVLNNGNPITVNGNTATLTGIGPLNNSGAFTVVAYLSNLPQDATCRPTAVATIVVNNNPNEPQPNNPFTACEGEAVIFNAPAGYTYLWATDASTQQITVFNSSVLPVTITNAEGCSQSLTYESQIIANPSEPQPQSVSVCGSSNVTLIGPAGYNYLWEDGTTLQSIEVQTAGLYDLTISNDIGCTQILTYEVIDEGLNLPDPQPVGICGVQNVMLDGPAGYTYLWSTNETMQSIQVSSIGTYTLSVTDLTGCTQDLTYLVTDAGNLDLTNPAPVEICPGEFTSLVGPTGFSYNWSNGSSSRIIMVNAPGFYTLEVTDDNGCMQILNFVVLQADVAVEAQPDPIIACVGEVVNLQAPEGYSYTWQSGEQSSNLNVTEPGTYNVEILNGCAQTLSFEVTYLQLPTTTAVGQNPSACGIDDGVITFTFTGIADGIYDLTFKAGTFESVLVMNGTATVTGLSEGFYNFITIADENTCAATTDNIIELISPDFVEPPTVSGINQYCEGDGIKSLIAKGRTKAIFTWYSDEMLNNVIYVGSNYFPMGNAETVYVTQTINGNCESAATAFTITINPLPVLENQTISVCSSSNELVLDLTSYEAAIGVTGGVWSDNAGGIPNPAAYMFTNFTSINYSVVNGAGCTALAQIKLIINDAEINTQAVSICNNLEGNFIDLLATNNWNDEVAVSDWTTNDEIVVDPSNAEITQDGQVFELITSSNGACDTKNLLIINIEEAPIIEAVASCRNSSDLNEFYVDVFTTKNPSFNNIIVSDGIAQQTALGNNQLTFGPYNHSGSGVAGITFEAYFEESSTCPVTVTANEVLCGPAQSCDCNDPANAGTILAQSKPGTFRNDNHTQIYVLTDFDGNIISSNNTGLFTGLGNGDFDVYAINVDNFDAYAINVATTTEDNISVFIPSKSYNNFCYEISEAASYSITCDCLPFVCPSINDVKTTGDICEGETFDVTVSGITNVTQVQNNEADFEILVGYYNSFVALPDPYSTAPDGLLNNGNPVSVTDGVAQLNNMGASLAGGNYTIVAYLSQAPEDLSCVPMDRAFIKIHESPALNPTINPICLGNNGVIHPNVSGGLFPYKIEWITPVGELYSVATFTIAQATLEDAGTYTVNVSDVRNCSSTAEVEVEVLDGDLGYQEVFVCEDIPGGAVDAIVDLTIYENDFGVEGGTWINESNNAVVDATNVSLNGTNVFRFEYHLDNNVQCQSEGVLLLNIAAANSEFCGGLIDECLANAGDTQPAIEDICDCETDITIPLSLTATAVQGSFETDDYSLIYLLVNDANSIMDYNNNGVFTDLSDQMSYSVYVVNVLDEDLNSFEAILNNGANIQQMNVQSGPFENLCYDLNNNFSAYSSSCNCEPPNECLANAGDTQPAIEDNCDCETDITIPLSLTATAVQGSYETDGYGLIYLLVNDANSIMNYNNNGVFTDLSDQTSYSVYIVNVLDEDLNSFETILNNGANIQEVNDQSGSFENLCYDLNNNFAAYSSSCNCEPPNECLANAGVATLQAESAVFCDGDLVGPFEVDYFSGTDPGAGYTYIWLATDGAPDYNILDYTEADATDLTGNFSNLAAGNYCIHGFSVEGILATFESYIENNNIENGVQVATAISEGALCADLIVADCISVEIKALPVANINSSTSLCNISGGNFPTEVDLSSLIITDANIGSGAWYAVSGGTEPLPSTLITSATLAIGTTNFYYIIDDGPCRSINYVVNINVLDCSEAICTYSLNTSDVSCNADGTFNLALSVDLANVLSDEFFVNIGGVDYGPYTDSDNDGTELINVENVAANSGTNSISIADGQSGEITPPATIFISELHYDNFSSDVNESIEVTATAGTDLSNYIIELYNGNGGAVYNSMTLSSVVNEEADGYGSVAFTYPSNGIQNGPDAVALVDASDAENLVIVEFIGYEVGDEPFFATSGTAVGLQPLEIGAEEPGEIGESLQLTDLGWVGPITDSFGSLNENLTVQTGNVTIECSYNFDVEFPPCGACSLNVTAAPVSCQSNQFFVDITVDATNPTSSQFTIEYVVFGFVITNYGNFDYNSGTVNIGPLPADGNTSYEFIVRDVDASDCQSTFIIEPQSCPPARGNIDDIPIILIDPLDLVFDEFGSFNDLEIGTLDEITDKGNEPIFVNDKTNWKTNVSYLKPNPATNNLFIGINSKTTNNIHFEVVDVAGRVLVRNMKAVNEGINEIELDVSTYKPGIYFIKMLQGDTIFHKKFIKE